MKAVKVFGIFALLAALIGGVVAWKVFGPTLNNPNERFLYIPTGATYDQVKDSLLANDFISSSFWFHRLASYAEYPQNVKAGKYEVKDNGSLYRLVKSLRRGTQVPVNLVITKVRTREDFAARLGKRFEVDSAAVLDFINSNDSLARFNVDTATFLTMVIPNTYTYYWNSTLPQILAKLHAEEEKFWNEERRERAAAQNLSPKEVYILASIVEEETNKQDDKGKIASVYMNRLETGMPLGADPTVKFAMRDFGLKRIYHKHLQYSSPYNTYRNKGLPPGPICTPSIKTLDAVLDAPETNYLYFVARADFSGYSNFSTNYQQHLMYAREYQNALNKYMESRTND